MCRYFSVNLYHITLVNQGDFFVSCLFAFESKCSNGHGEGSISESNVHTFKGHAHRARLFSRARPKEGTVTKWDRTNEFHRYIRAQTCLSLSIYRYVRVRGCCSAMSGYGTHRSSSSLKREREIMWIENESEREKRLCVLLFNVVLRDMHIYYRHCHF